MESLTVQQEENGKEIQRIVVNYRKDGSDRKTVDYYKEHLKRLENAWNAFEAVDTEIRSLKNVDLQHEYFISNYYQEIEGIYNTYRAHFNSKLEVRIDENREFVLVQHDGHGSDVRPKFQVETSLQVTQAENEEISETIRRVVRRQNRNFQTLKRLLATVEGQQSKHYYGVKFDSIKQLWSDIEQDDRQIWESTDSPSTYGYQEHIYAEYEAQVQEALIDISMNLEQTAVPHTVMGTNQGMHSPLKLPKVTLPKFDGDYLYWQQFRDLFSQMVHNQDIPGCQKMFYLKTNLSGEAERLIRHLTITEDNYAIAWKTLQERYNNPRPQVSALVNKLLSQQSHANDYPSAASLKTLHDTTQECLLGLQNLGVSTKSWDPLLLHWMVKKLDKTTHTLYEQSLDNPRQLQNLDDFLNFLELRFQSLEVLGSKGRIDDRYRKQGVAQALTASATDSRGNKQCILCKDKHALHLCKIFTGAKIVDRVKIINKHNLCRNCLRTGHRAVNCGSRGCTKCELKHHTLIHSDNREAMKASHPGKVTNAEPEDILSFPSTVATSTNRHEVNYVFLGTVVVKIMNSKGESVKCRALLDSGSQVNLITTKMVKCLKLITKGDQLHIQGVGGNKTQSQARVNLLMESLLCDYSARVEAFVIGNIVPPQPAQTFDVSKWPIPKNIKLADPDFYKSEEIDLLLGAEFYHELLSIGQIKMAKDLPVLQNTIFGWIVVGKTKQASISAAVCGVCSEDEKLNGIIERFWKLEEVDSSMSTLTSVEKKCESHFNQTVKRDVNGRFIVSLPFSDDPNRLGDSQEIAMPRFLSLQRRLQRDRSLKEQYVQFMTEYLQRNHMEEVNTRGLKGPVYYLPHHSVLKLDSSTTKLRVVFDASAKSNSGLSLNNLLHAGPTIQDDLFSILLRFRMPRFVFTADIKQMYRQILISEEDRKYQLVFWRNDASHPIKCFQLRTVTYGTTPAPYLATKCLQKLAHDRVSSYPLGAQVLERDFYVDDVLTGSDSMSTALMMRDQLQKLLQEGCFKLHKWCSNHPQLLNGIPFEDREAQLIFEDDNPEKVKTLGLIWYPKEDEFHVKFNSKHSSAVTKRTISSDIARLFDPLGIMSPVIVAAKIFLQELWQLKLDWDAALPLEMHSRWCQFREELQEIDNLHFNRHIFAHEATHNIQLHVFADASEKAFGAVAYIRSLNKEKRTIIRLLCAKSRVAPLKRQTLPRLELCAAALATKLADRIKTNLKLAHTQIYFWTDSEIVLNWINSPAQHYQTFVANRISVIQGSSIAEQWRHVRSSENPADILSRGLTPVKLKGCNTWFYGPMFLHLSEDRWPASYQQHATCDLEKRKCYLSENVAAVNTAANQADLSRQIDNGHWLQNIDHGNSFRKLQRILAYSMRFIAHCKKPLRPSTTKLLSPKELENALAVIVRTIQQESFKTEIKQLNEKLEVHPTSALSTLNPFLDSQGIIRVGGRLKNSSLSYDAKHQMLLPYAHPITNLLMTSIHQENMHIGPQGLLAQTRQRFWPVRGKNIARSIIQHCTWCAKRKPKFLEQMMGDLPATRVQPARPFINSGVDYCGPVWVHYKGRGRKPQKAYIAVFCCFATKAIHLELVSDLTTEAFIGALRRFVGRRGHCKTIYCDNATNFVGASNQLSELIETMHSTRSQEKIVSECSKKGIEFKFIPPRAPHFGGLWEAAVKSTKLLLQKGTASASLTYEELETLLIEVEAILNSRPLTQLSNDPNDLAALTPGHFLIGEPLTNAVDTSAEPLKGSLLTRWKLVSHIKQEFWRRWSSEYLNELQQRYKWRKRVDNAKPGIIVVIKDDNAPVMKWHLGRIIQTFKDDNGLVRVAEVKTASGILKRPIHKLAPLPCEINDDSQPETEPGVQLDSTISINRYNP